MNPHFSFSALLRPQPGQARQPPAAEWRPLPGAVALSRRQPHPRPVRSQGGRHQGGDRGEDTRAQFRMEMSLFT